MTETVGLRLRWSLEFKGIGRGKSVRWRTWFNRWWLPLLTGYARQQTADGSQQLARIGKVPMTGTHDSAFALKRLRARFLLQHRIGFGAVQTLCWRLKQWPTVDQQF